MGNKVNKSWLLIGILLFSIQNIHGANYSEEYTNAVSLMEKHQFQKAIVIMKPLTKTNNNYNLFLSLGDAYAGNEEPEKALHDYNIVYQRANKSNNVLFKRVALFKIARMQLWLNKGDAAVQSYERLLAMKLSDNDKNIALNGLTAASKKRQKKITQEKRQTIEENQQQARNFLQSLNGDSAYALIKAHLINEPNVELYFIAAESMSLTDKPQQALEYYQKALQLSHDKADQKYALFGIAKMQFWLGQYVSAGKSYQQLLKYQLTPTEHELALAGWVKSLAYYDRPRTAYQMIPADLVFTTKDLVIAASQASSWSNWSDITASILTTYQPITHQINLNSALGKDLQDLQWQTKLATSPGVLTPSFFASHDSENFNKTRATIDYSHYWSQLSQTSVGLDSINYAQNAPNKLNARGIYLGQTLRPTRNVILHGQIEPTEYKNLSASSHNNWAPFLWDTNVTYTPNDYVSLRVLALRQVIETFSAFEDKITDNQYATSLSINPFPYVHVNGTYSRLNINDGNNRDTYFLSSTVLLLPNAGLSATGTFREYTDKFTSPNYFSPYNYKAASLLLRVGRRLGATWHYYLDGGLGRQYIISRPGDSTAASPTYQWGLGVTGPISSWLVLNAYYADVQQASAFLDSPGYHYQYGGISLNIMMF